MSPNPSPTPTTSMNGRDVFQRFFAKENRNNLKRIFYVAIAIAGIVFVAVEALGPTPPNYFLEMILIQILYAMSVNILIGYAHLPSLGQAGFFGAGAYSAALTIQGVPLLLSLLISVVLTGILAFLVGLLAVRTSGITFANVTLAFGQMLYLIAANTDWVGGENGLLATIPRDVTPQHLWLIIVFLVALGCAAIWWIFKTPFGETIIATRDNPDRATSLGISNFRYRLAAFVIAGALAGLAGALYAFATGIVTADTLYWSRSGEPIIMVLLGGSKKFWGPAIGAIALTFILQQVGQGSTLYLIYVGAILLGVLFLLPNGLLSIPSRLAQAKERWSRNRKSGHSQEVGA